MTLTVQTAEDELRQLTLTIQVDEERVRKAMQAKARELSRDVNLPGFRPGKAPYDVIVRRIGEETLRFEAIEDLAQPVFEEALEQEGIEPYAQPTLEDIEPNPVTLKFIVPLSPQVTLGDYRALRQPVEEVQVTEEAVDEALELVRVRHQSIETVERPAQPFVENIVGMNVGDQKSFSFVFPDPYEDEAEFAGREATFDVSVLEVKERELPELNDDLAKQDGNFETLDELREETRKRLVHDAEDTAKGQLIDQMIDRLLDDATLVYPPAAVEAQIDDMVGNFKNYLSRSGWKFEDYLNLSSMTEDSLRNEYREEAETQLRRQLVLRQFILDEKLRIGVSDIDEIVEERVARFSNEELRENMRNYYRTGRGLDQISSEVLSDKTYERARAIFLGEAPDLATLDDEEADEEE
ncbi:MAG: hypothetical protein DCC51_03775 [Anaerolineae bacterium]|nr:MAG: hypothetical protein DCC51_03775 [Anaerolineae bacterium]